MSKTFGMKTSAVTGWLLQRPGVACPDGSGIDNVGQEIEESKHQIKLVGRSKFGRFLESLFTLQGPPQISGSIGQGMHTDGRQYNPSE